MKKNPPDEAEEGQMTTESHFPSHRNQDCHHRPRQIVVVVMGDHQPRQIVVVVMGAMPRHPPGPAARTQEEEQTTPTGGDKTPLLWPVRRSTHRRPQQAEPNHPTLKR